TIPPTTASTIPPTTASTIPPTASTIPPTTASTIPPTTASTIPPTTASSIPQTTKKETTIQQTTTKDTAHSSITSEGTIALIRTLTSSKPSSTILQKVSEGLSDQSVTRHHQFGTDPSGTNRHKDNGSFENTNLKFSPLPSFSTHEAAPAPQTKKTSVNFTSGTTRGFQQVQTTHSPPQRVTIPEQNHEQTSGASRSSLGLKLQDVDMTATKRDHHAEIDSRDNDGRQAASGAEGPFKSSTLYPLAETTSQETDSGSRLEEQGVISSDQLPGQDIDDYDVTSRSQAPDIEHEEDTETRPSSFEHSMYSISEKILLTEDLDEQRRGQLKSEPGNSITRKPGLENVDTYEPGLENVDTYEPGLENVDTYEPGLENVDTYEPGQENVDTFKPELENVATYKPGMENVDTHKSELEKWNVLLPQVEIIITPKPNENQTPGSSGRKDVEKEIVQKPTRSQLSELSPTVLQVEMDQSSAVTSADLSVYPTGDEAMSTDPMTGGGHTMKATESTSLAMTTQSDRNASLTASTDLSDSSLSSAARDVATIHRTRATLKNDMTEAAVNVTLSNTERPSQKSLETAQIETSSQYSGAVKMESSSQTSEEMIRTTTRKLLEKTPVETGTERRTASTSSSPAQISISETVSTAAHSGLPQRKSSDGTTTSTSASIKSLLIPQSTHQPHVPSSNMPPPLKTSPYTPPNPSPTTRPSLSSTHSPTPRQPLTSPSTAKPVQVTKSHETTSIPSTPSTDNINLPVTHTPSTDNINLPVKHTSELVASTMRFQTPEPDATITTTKIKTATTAKMGLNSSLTALTEITETTATTRMTPATTQPFSIPTTPQTTLFDLTTRLSTPIPSFGSTHMAITQGPTLLTTTRQKTATASINSTTPFRSTATLTSQGRTSPTSTSQERKSPTLTTQERSSPTSTTKARTSPTSTTQERTSPTSTTPERTPPTSTTQETTSTMTTEAAPLQLGSPCGSDAACNQSVHGSICWKRKCMCHWDRYPTASKTCVHYDASNFTSPSLTSQSNSSFTIQLPRTSRPPNVSLVYTICWNSTLRACQQATAGDPTYVIPGLTPGTVYNVTVEVIISRADSGKSLTLLLTSLFNVTDPPDVGGILNKWPSPDGRQLHLTFEMPAGNFDFCSAEVFELDIGQNVPSKGQSRPRTQEFNCTDLDLQNLEPGIEYKLTIHVVVNSMFGHRNSSKVNYWVSTPGGAPDAVHNVIIQNITSSSAIVTWSRPASANGYVTGYDVTMCVAELSDKDLIQEKKTPCDVTCVNVTQWKGERWTAENLCVATDYVVKVTASNQYRSNTEGSVIQSVSPVRSQAFSTLSVVPLPPRNVRVEAVTATTVSLRWDAPVSYPGSTSYIISFRSSNTVNTTVIHGYFNTYVMIRDLTAFTSYTWTISANTSAGTSKDTSGTVITLEAESDKVINLRVTGSSPDTITVTWARPIKVYGVLSGYVILVHVSAKPSLCTRRVIIVQRNTSAPVKEFNQTACDVTDVTHTEITTYTVTGLEPCENYTIFVAAYNGAGLGVLTGVTSSTAVSAPSSTQGMECSGVIKGVLSLSWAFKVDSKCPVNYSISVYQSGHFSTGLQYTRINQTYTRSRNLTFSGLKSFRIYKFNVTASTTAGSANDVKECRTLSDAPGPVQNLRVQQVPGRPELHVTWQCPDDDNKNGILKSFHLVRKSQSGQTYKQSLPVSKTMSCAGSVPGSVPSSVPSSVPLEDMCNSSYSMSVQAVPEINYTISVRIQNCNDVFGLTTSTSYYNPALVPPTMPWFPRPSDNVEKILNSTSFTVTICPSRLLNNSSGAILTFGIIVCRSEYCDIDADRKWHYFVKNMATWAKSKKENFELPYRVTNSSWEDVIRKQNGGQEDVTFEVGTDTDCQTQPKTTYCNGPLSSGQFFRARVFACTSAGCVVSNTTHDYVTAASKSDSSDYIVIGGALAGIAVAIVVLVAVIVIKLRMRPKKPPRRKISSRMSQLIAMEEIVAPKDDGKSKPIKIKDFDATLVKLHADSNALLNQEYLELDKLSPLYPTEVGSDLDHRADNRWTNIIPFDHSRVKLSIPEGKETGHDYINANFIAGLDSKQDYIATQGPLTRTVPDFWRMIWEQQVSVIVMLSDFAEMDKRTSIIREKVARYFPDEEESNPYHYGQIVVARTGKLDAKDWEIRTLKLTHATEKKNRFVKHFFFKYWSDHEADINPTDLIDFVRVVQAETNTQPRAPVVVHCSAGVGRTGTFIAVDYFNRLISGMKQKGDKTKSSMRDNWTVDIFGRVLSMRDKRRFMVQSRTQYIFIYDVVQELLKQAFKSEKVKGQEKGETYEDGPSTSSGSLKEDAVYDDV
ncbi:unnamed protein product, partial [Lymnaea stagnalis]